MAQKPQQLEPFLQKQAEQVSNAATAQLKQHTAQCFAKHFSSDALLGRGQVFQAELESEAGPVKAGSQHPLLAFLSTPRLPPELAQYLDR
jgi:hypothetical protein